MAREFAPRMDWAGRHRRGPGWFSPDRHDRVVNNHDHHLPIPATVFQMMQAFDAIDEHCTTNPRLLDQKGLRKRMVAEIQRVVQGMPTDDVSTAVVMRICRKHLNGFAAMR